jgi:hypothetical protein
MNHSTETLLRIEAIFNEALSLPVAERQALIDARCDRDPALISEVLSLLKACAAEEWAPCTWRIEPTGTSSSKWQSS